VCDVQTADMNGHLPEIIVSPSEEFVSERLTPNGVRTQLVRVYDVLFQIHRTYLCEVNSEYESYLRYSAVSNLLELTAVNLPKIILIFIQLTLLNVAEVALSAITRLITLLFFVSIVHICPVVSLCC